MAYLYWTDDLNTGIDVIDKQHRCIVDYINELSVADAKDDKANIKHVLDELIEYTLSHFSFEEELMEKANYPFLKAHKRIHEIFTKRVVECLHRAEKDENVAPELLSMLKVWLFNHIKGDDADYAEIVKESLGIKGVADKTGSWLGGALKKLFG
jgi:hemerythrin